MNKLPQFLSRCQAPEVWVQTNKVIDLIGESKTQELVLARSEMQEGDRPYTTILQQIENMKIRRSNTVACFDRKALVEAINAATLPKFPSPQKDYEQHSPTTSL